MDQAKTNLLDKVLGYISPKWGAERQAYRNVSEVQSSYQAAFPNRLSTRWGQTEALNALPHLNLTVARNIRARALSLTENNILASSILDRAVENIVGSGFKVQAKTSTDDWNKKADELWENWTHEADFYGDSWREHQKKTCYGLLRDGDRGVALLSRGQLQPVDADYVSNELKSQAFLHDGIELDSYGRVKNYWVMTWVDFTQKKWRPVPADKFVFVAHKRRVTQYRGESYFAQSFDLYDQLNQYIEGVVVAQRMAACLALFIRTANPTAFVQGLNTQRNSQGVSQRKLAPLEPGSIQMLGENEDISQINPQQPGTQFGDNVRSIVRLLGLPFGLPIEYSLLDFSTVSGNTAKASAEKAQRSFETTQHLLIDDYYRPIYRWKIDQWIKEGELEDIPDKYHCLWSAEPWPYLDPVKEIQAIALAIDAGLETETRALIARGLDPEKTRQERAHELDEKRQLNIPIYHTSNVQPLVKETLTAKGTGTATDIEEGSDISEENSGDNAQPSNG